MTMNVARRRVRSVPPTRARGFTLVEIMVAFAVLSFGLLALAGLQITTMRYVQGSGYRNLATMQASSIAEIMRGNRSEIKSGLFNNPTGAATTTCFSTGCTTSQMALTQYWLWQQQSAVLLPSGASVVCVDSTPNDGSSTAPACDNVAGAPYVVKVFWTDDKLGTAARFVTALNP